MIIQPTTPSGYVIFCDDVRQEVSGKHTLVGMYGGEMTVFGTAPAVVPMLCAVVRYRENPEHLPQLVRFEVIKITPDSRTVLMEASTDIPPPPTEFEFPDSLEEDTHNFVELGFTAKISPLEISEDCQIKVRAYAGENEIRLGALAIKLAPPRSEETTDGTEAE